MPWEINNKEEIFPLATRTSFSKAQRSYRECQGLVFSQLPLKHLSSLPLFLIRLLHECFCSAPEGQLWSAINQNSHRKSLISTLRERKTEKCRPLQAERARGLASRKKKKSVKGQQDAKAEDLFWNYKHKLVRLNYRNLDYHFILTTIWSWIYLKNCNL